MKKIGIVTLTGDKNYGNKLQNYALHYFLTKYNYELFTIWPKTSLIKKILSFIKRKIILLFPFIDRNCAKKYLREKQFKKFDKIYLQRYYVDSNLKKIDDKFDYFVIGSDQIWNPNVINYYFGFSVFNTNVKLFSYAASLGVSEVTDEYKEEVKRLFKKSKIPYVSVRESIGAEIISEITNRDDINVNIDPTLLLNSDEWDKLSKKPIQLKEDDKYILNYFLGELSEIRKREIEKIAQENNCFIINILDINDPFYTAGPSEFLYLEKNAFLICTDSFHSSVFSIIFNKPFIVFDREDNKEKMNSRLDTLLSKFKLENRKFNGKITDELLKCDYTEAYKILDEERKKSDEFLRNALDIKE